MWAPTLHKKTRLHRVVGLRHHPQVSLAGQFDTVTTSRFGDCQPGRGWCTGGGVYSSMMMVDDEESLGVSITSTRVGNGDLRVSVTTHTLGEGGRSSVTIHRSGVFGGGEDVVTMQTFGERTGLRGASPSLTT
ncbi:hypothetical protein HPB50_007465 [Hyalomma asiaticum]|uniref:Uncharacterized protein n=1 Tax=Hyalomma asiaticum TaxID=266040 RepID=A0ACB7TDD6_HYAAI|nr:hypothetical protein HPB50_007465 [Hyalomma asiaticum]